MFERIFFEYQNLSNFKEYYSEEPVRYANHQEQWLNFNLRGRMSKYQAVNQSYSFKKNTFKEQNLCRNVTWHMHMPPHNHGTCHILRCTTQRNLTNSEK